MALHPYQEFKMGKRREALGVLVRSEAMRAPKLKKLFSELYQDLTDCAEHIAEQDVRIGELESEIESSEEYYERELEVLRDELKAQSAFAESLQGQIANSLTDDLLEED